jgi:hypothetical protein
MCLYMVLLFIKDIFIFFVVNMYECVSKNNPLIITLLNKVWSTLILTFTVAKMSLIH